MLTVKVDTVQVSRHVSCTHWPPMLAVIPAERGCKVRCLTCGRTGPERESTDLAWTALISLRAKRRDGEA